MIFSTATRWSWSVNPEQNFKNVDKLLPQQRPGEGKAPTQNCCQVFFIWIWFNIFILGFKYFWYLNHLTYLFLVLKGTTITIHIRHLHETVVSFSFISIWMHAFHWQCRLVLHWPVPIRKCHLGKTDISQFFQIGFLQTSFFKINQPQLTALRSIPKADNKLEVARKRHILYTFSSRWKSDSSNFLLSWWMWFHDL